MSKKTVKEMIENALPEVEVVESVPTAGADSPRARTGRPGASLAELRRKYLGGGAATPGIPLTKGMVVGVAHEDEVVVKQVRNRRTSADPADDPGPRAMVISRNEGIVGSQG